MLCKHQSIVPAHTTDAKQTACVFGLDGTLYTSLVNNEAVSQSLHILSCNDYYFNSG